MDLIIHDLTFSDNKLLNDAAAKKNVPIEQYIKQAIFFIANRDMGMTHDTAFFNKYVTIMYDEYIPKRELYEKYRSYVESRTNPASPMSFVMFCKHVKIKLPVDHARITIDTIEGPKRVQAWRGIGWKAVGDNDDSNKI